MKGNMTKFSVPSSHRKETKQKPVWPKSFSPKTEPKK